MPNFAMAAGQPHRPQLFGSVANIGPGSLKWSAGILFLWVPPNRAKRSRGSSNTRFTSDRSFLSGRASAPREIGKGVVAAGLAVEGHVNPQHAIRLQQPRDALPTGVDRMKAEIADEAYYDGLAPRVVAGHEHHRCGGIPGCIRHDLEPDLVQYLEHRRAGCQ